MQTFTHHLPNLELTGHEFVVPLDYDHPDGEQITVFARAVSAVGKAQTERPWLVYFQGGPGSPAPRPTDRSGWLKRALQEYHVLLLDQRGTGLSTSISTQSLLQRASLPSEQAAYLKHFRADNIVRDAELIRRQLLGEQGQWTVLGQSFGGFCVTHYLSVAPAGLQAALITGGLPPLERSAEEVYRATYQRVLTKNDRYYHRYPEDVERVQLIVSHLLAEPIPLPGGGWLTARRFLQLGLAFGRSDGFEQMHYLLEEAFAHGGKEPRWTLRFLRAVEAEQTFETNPLYAILHEAIYCQGQASRWAAERVRSEFSDFAIDPTRRVNFTGEMIYPWMFEDYAHLQPLADAAELLAQDEEWARPYHVQQLRQNVVPCAAVIYYDDMYVERQYSEETAQEIAGIQLWITNEFEHNGLRADGERLLTRLLKLARRAS